MKIITLKGLKIWLTLGKSNFFRTFPLERVLVSVQAYVGKGVPPESAFYDPLAGEGGKK